MAVSCLAPWLILATLIVKATDIKADNPKGIHYILTQKLLSEYGLTTPRPVLDVRQQIDVALTLEIVRVIELNERDQTLQQSAFLGMEWHDDHLSWNTTAYPGVDVVVLPPDQIWRPDLHLYGNVDRNFESLKDVNVWVYPNGSVTWVTPVILYTACRIDARLFPFDTQHCILRFGSWSYTLDQLNLYPNNQTEEATRRYFTENGVWYLEDVHSEVIVNEYTEGIFPEVVFTILLHRRPLFQVFNFIIPCGLLSLLNLLGFILPTESGEKVSLGITNLLALVLFQQLISGSLPPSSVDMPVINFYFTPMILIGCMSIVSGVLVAKFYHHDKTKPVPKWLILFTQINPLTARRDHVEKNEEHLPGESTVDKTIAYSVDEPPPRRSRTPIDYTSDWQRVTAAIDNLFLVVGVTMTVVAITVTALLFATSAESHV